MPESIEKISASEIFKSLDNMADGVFIVDNNLRIQLWNKSAEQILGNRDRDVQGHYIDTNYLVDKLTRRQHEVLTPLVQGFRTREIANNLSISQYTVRNHKQLISQKFKVNNRLEAVAYALKNGLLDYVNDEDVLYK